MNAHLSFAQIALLIAYAGGMAGGQLLFKMAALTGNRRPPCRAAVRHDAQWVLRGGRVVLCRADRAMGLDIKFHAIITGLCLRRRGLRGDAVAWCGRFRGADLGETCYRYCFDLLRPLVCRRISPPCRTSMSGS